MESKVRKLIGYVALIWLAYLFVGHGIQALIGNPGFIILITGVGFSYGVAKILLFIVGIIDMIIALALFKYRVPGIIIYAGLWPIVPYIMSYIVTGYFSFRIFISPVLAIVIYLVFIVGLEND